LVRPAEDLVNQIQAMIANPQAGARIKDTHSHDEFDNLTLAFNSLLSQVETQETSLRKQERLAMLGTMQAEFAHEVANPLSALVAYSRRSPIYWKKTRSIWKRLSELAAF
jgi:C4-dicarboxylate-specific signal transduction histidine kinase